MKKITNTLKLAGKFQKKIAQNIGDYNSMGDYMVEYNKTHPGLEDPVGQDLKNAPPLHSPSKIDQVPPPPPIELGNESPTQTLNEYTPPKDQPAAAANEYTEKLIKTVKLWVNRFGHLPSSVDTDKKIYLLANTIKELVRIYNSKSVDDVEREQVKEAIDLARSTFPEQLSSLMQLIPF